MAKLVNKDEMLKFMGDSHAQLFTVAKMLIGAHGAALAACVTVLKDAASIPQYRGVGVFFILSGAGLIAAILNYASVFMINATVRSSLISDEDPNDAASAGFLGGLNVITLGVAIVLLLAAIGLVIWRASSS